MPITKSAKKAIRGSLRKKAVNDQKRRAMKDKIKKFQKMVKADKAKAGVMLPGLFQAIDKSAKTGVIKKNNASRKKARLSKLLK
jgi:small subunit ribosomal protein S20